MLLGWKACSKIQAWYCYLKAKFLWEKKKGLHSNFWLKVIYAGTPPQRLSPRKSWKLCALPSANMMWHKGEVIQSHFCPSISRWCGPDLAPAYLSDSEFIVILYLYFKPLSILIAQLDLNNFFARSHLIYILSLSLCFRSLSQSSTPQSHRGEIPYEQGSMGFW